MKTALVVAFAVLLFSSVARADEVETAYGALYIPNGSIVTSITYSDPGDPQAIVSLTFADGNGVFYDAGPFGAWGSIDFTTPVSGLSFDWFGLGGFSATDNFGDVYYAPLQPFTDEPENTGIATFTGPGITSIEWTSPDNTGLVGIESLTYTLDGTDPPNVPEPSSLLLSGMGLAALIGLTCRNRAATRQSY